MLPLSAAPPDTKRPGWYSHLRPLSLACHYRADFGFPPSAPAESAPDSPDTRRYIRLTPFSFKGWPQYLDENVRQRGSSQQEPYSSSVPGLWITLFPSTWKIVSPSPNQTSRDLETACEMLPTYWPRPRASSTVCNPLVTGLLLRHSQCSRLFSPA